MVERPGAVGAAVGELAAFREECEVAEETLGAARDADPSRPGLGEWSLGRLAGHLVGVAGRLDHLAGGEPPAGPPRVDRHGYFAAQPAWAVEDPVLPPGEWAPRFAGAWRASDRRFEAMGPAALVASPCGAITAVEYLATRVLEVVVHHMDVCAALDRPRVTTPAAGRLTLALLDGLLDGPRPRNFGRTRFILAATGRIRVADPRFPVMR